MHTAEEIDAIVTHHTIDYRTTETNHQHNMLHNVYTTNQRFQYTNSLDFHQTIT